MIEAAAVERRFSASQIIVICKERANRLFVVSEGCLNYSSVTDDGREILLGRLVPGDAFGIATFLSEPGCYLGTAKAVCDTTVFFWDYRLIRQLATAYPRLAENGMRIALRSVALHVERHVALVSKSARERVACALARLGTRGGRVLPTGIEVDIKNEDLASLADVSLFTASRLVTLWERKGILEKSRGRVLIRSPERLLAA